MQNGSNVNLRWWYGIIVFPTISIAYSLFGLGLEEVTSIYFLLIVFLFGIVSMGMDSRAVNKNKSIKWNPNTTAYVVGSLFFVPILLLYLYRRHEHIGIP